MERLRISAELALPIDAVTQTLAAIARKGAASRITMEITDVRVQRLQEISEDDAKAEGVEPWTMTEQEIADIQISDCHPDEKELARLMGPGGFSYRFTYQMLWDELNAKRGFAWDTNPWVWAITFERAETAQ